MQMCKLQISLQRRDSVSANVAAEGGTDVERYRRQ